MENLKIVLLNLLIPFLGTTLGAGTVFFMKKEMTSRLKTALSGFAAGVMIAASVWSLLLPSLDIAKEQGKLEWVPATIGFMIGIIFLLILDSIIPHLHYKNNKPEGIKAKIKEEIMLVLAVTLHNIPEGMTIGVILASILIGQNGITEAGGNISKYFDRAKWNNRSRSISFSNRTCYTKFSRRSNNISTIKKQRC